MLVALVIAAAMLAGCGSSSRVSQAALMRQLLARSLRQLNASIGTTETEFCGTPHPCQAYTDGFLAYIETVKPWVDAHAYYVAHRPKSH
jgi:hypothetical protein